MLKRSISILTASVFLFINTAPSYALRPTATAASIETSIALQGDSADSHINWTQGISIVIDEPVDATEIQFLEPVRVGQNYVGKVKYNGMVYMAKLAQSSDLEYMCLEPEARHLNHLRTHPFPYPFLPTPRYFLELDEYEYRLETREDRRIRTQPFSKLVLYEVLPEGETLADKIEAWGRPIPKQEAIDIILEVAYALGHLHDAGFYHWDIKPQNIWITDEGAVYILDFGLAFNDPAEIKNRLLYQQGTDGYRSPLRPQFAREKPMAEAGRLSLELSFWGEDIYGLAMTLAAMLTGKTAIHTATLYRKKDTIVVTDRLWDEHVLIKDDDPELFAILTSAGIGLGYSIYNKLPGFIAELEDYQANHWAQRRASHLASTLEPDMTVRYLTAKSTWLKSKIQRRGYRWDLIARANAQIKGIAADRVSLEVFYNALTYAYRIFGQLFIWSQRFRVQDFNDLHASVVSKFYLIEEGLLRYKGALREDMGIWLEPEKTFIDIPGYQRLTKGGGLEFLPGLRLLFQDDPADPGAVRIALVPTKEDGAYVYGIERYYRLYKELIEAGIPVAFPENFKDHYLGEFDVWSMEASATEPESSEPDPEDPLSEPPARSSSTAQRAIDLSIRSAA